MTNHYPQQPDKEFGQRGDQFFCPFCGTQLPAGNDYCTRCGTFVTGQGSTRRSIAASASAFIYSPEPPIVQRAAASRSTNRTVIVWVLASLGLLAIAAGLVLLIRENLPAVSPVAGRLTEAPQIEGTDALGFLDEVPTADPGGSSLIWGSPGENEITPEALRPTATRREVPAATVKPTRTPTPEPTATNAVTACPGAPKQRIEVDEDAIVCTRNDVVFLRSGPGKKYRVLSRISPGVVVMVIGGPFCSDNWSYWEVKLSDGTTGWMSEGGDSIDPYFLCPN